MARARRPGLVVVANALAPTARVARPGPALLTVVLGAIPALVAAARGQPVNATTVIVLALATGAAAGWAVDDPVAELFAPLPIASPSRLLLRVLSVAAVVAVTSTVLVVALVVGPGLPSDLRSRAPEAAAAAGLALAVGLVAARRGERAAGPVAVTAGVVAAVVIGGLAMRWPAIFPALGSGPGHARWWLVAVAALGVAAWNGRDPSRPPAPTPFALASSTSARRRADGRSRRPRTRPGSGR